MKMKGRLTVSKHIDDVNRLFDAAQWIGDVEDESEVSQAIPIKWPARLRINAAVATVAFVYIFRARTPSIL